MSEKSTYSLIRFMSKTIGIFTCTLWLSLVFQIQYGYAQSLIVAVRDPQCLGYTYPYRAFSYSSIDAAVKDTIPGEWWPPSALNVSTIPYSTLQAASIQVRSRIMWNQQGGQSAPFGCDNYTMNTAQNAQLHGNSSSYQSNSATDSTRSV